MITRGDEIGGAQIHVHDLARGILAAGHRVLVIVGGEGEFTELLRQHDVPIKSLSALVREIDPRRDAIATLQLYRVLREFKPDLLTCHSAKGGILGRLVARAMGVPTVFTAHGWIQTPGRLGPLQRLGALAERATGGLAEVTITVSDYDRRVAREHRLAPASRLRVIHNGVRDVTEDLRATPQREPARIVTAARISPQKDPFTLVEALSQIRDLPWTLELIGDGPRRPELERAIAAVGLEERIELVGFGATSPSVLPRRRSSSSRPTARASRSASSRP